MAHRRDHVGTGLVTVQRSRASQRLQYGQRLTSKGIGQGREGRATEGQEHDRLLLCIHYVLYGQHLRKSDVA